MISNHDQAQFGDTLVDLYAQCWDDYGMNGEIS